MRAALPLVRRWPGADSDLLYRAVPDLCLPHAHADVSVHTCSEYAVDALRAHGVIR